VANLLKSYIEAFLQYGDVLKMAEEVRSDLSNPNYDIKSAQYKLDILEEMIKDCGFTDPRSGGTSTNPVAAIVRILQNGLLPEAESRIKKGQAWLNQEITIINKCVAATNVLFISKINGLSQFIKNLEELESIRLPNDYYIWGNSVYIFTTDLAKINAINSHANKFLI
jgi:hypothetical protein